MGRRMNKAQTSMMLADLEKELERIRNQSPDALSHAQSTAGSVTNTSCNNELISTLNFTYITTVPLLTRANCSINNAQAGGF